MSQCLPGKWNVRDAIPERKKKNISTTKTEVSKPIIDNKDEGNTTMERQGSY